MKRIVLLLMAVLAITSCSKSDDKKDEERLPEISVSNNPISVKTGGTKDITIRVNESNWQIKDVKIENDKIAGVLNSYGNYRIFGVVKGITNLLITASNSQKDITKSIPIIVSDVEAQSIIMQDEIVIGIGKQQSRSITYTITPSDTSEKIVWASSDDRVATVEKGIVTGVKTGTCTITIIVGRLKSSCKVIVKENEEYQEPQKNEPNKEQQDQKEKEKANEQNKKDALIYFALAKTSLNNRLNKNKEFDFWINTLKALEVSKGNEDVYKEVEYFLKNNRFGTPRWIDSQQAEINKLIDNLKPQSTIINKYEEIKSFINAFNEWR